MSLKIAKATLIAFVAVSLATSKSNAVVLGNYTFDGDTLAPSSVAPGVNFSDFSYNPDATPGTPNFFVHNPGSAYQADRWPVNTTENAPPPNPLGDYFAYTVAPQPGLQLSLTSITLDERRSATGIRNFEVRSSQDNFTSPLSAFTVPDDSLFRSNQTTTLGTSFNNLSSPVTFRVYGYNAEGSLGTWGVDNVRTLGEVSSAQAVPFEFSPGLGILALGAWGGVSQLNSIVGKRRFSKSQFFKS